MSLPTKPVTRKLVVGKGSFMHRIVKRSSVYILTFTGNVDSTEMQMWFDESHEALRDTPRPFGVVIDIRSLEPLGSEAYRIFVKGLGLYKSEGMKRSGVISGDPAVSLQFRHLAEEAEIRRETRCIDAWKIPNWPTVVIDWLISGIEPESTLVSDGMDVRLMAMRKAGA